MYRVFLFIAFLSLSIAAPFGDGFSSSMGQRSMVNIRERPDETDLVDTLGAGYSFFKKQPIVSRPLIQQQLAINEQQAPITGVDDTSNQWSAYTQSSAFKQPVVRNFDSALTRQETQVLVQKPLIRTGENSYGQQQELPTFVPQQQPIVRNFDNSYGQQQESQVLLQKPLIRTTETSYGQRQELPTFVPQQQPIVRNFDNSYGQQQQESQVILQKPLIRTTETSYGQRQELPTFVPQQQPIIRNFDNSYGQQSQELPKFVPERQDWSTSVPQRQELPTFVPERQDWSTSVSQSQQPLIRNLGNSFNGQVQSGFNNMLNDERFGQRQPIFPSVQVSQPAFSQQNSFSHASSKIIPSSNFVSHSQPVVQTRETNSFGGW